MAFERFFRKIADEGEADSPLESAAQGILGAAAPFYAGGSVITRLLYSTGLRERGRLPVPVLSVGNITMGGTGKTPFCLWLIEWLRAQGRRPAVVSRGYGREDEDRLVLVHDGKRLRAGTRQAGDEPVLIAKTLGNVPVAACSDRHRAARALIRRFDCDVIVLDDGFQHHRLDRNGDIALVDTTRRLSGLKVFPRGTLREPASGLSRAHLIVMTRWQQAEDPGAVRREVRIAAPGVPVVRTKMSIDSVVRLSDGGDLDPEAMKGKKAIVVCGVGNPVSVRRTVEELGVRVVMMRQFSDHARIPRGFLAACDNKRRKAGADVIIVTEKDAVKLLEDTRPSPEVLALRIRVDFLTKKEEALAGRVLSARLTSGGLKGFLSA